MLELKAHTMLNVPAENVFKVADAIEMEEKLSCQSRLDWQSFWRDREEEEEAF